MPAVNSARIGAIIQARTSSTRLPRKVLKQLPYGSDVTVLQQVIRRTKRSGKLAEVIVATTTDDDDIEIVKLAEKEGVRWFRGSKNDVLERYYKAAKENKLDIVVRITSDCPCVDYEIINHVLEEHIERKVDFTSNAITATFPHGLDVEVVNFFALEKVFREVSDSYHKEHVCTYFYRNNSAAFKIFSVAAPASLRAPEIRITLDTADDYALLCAVFDNLFSKKEYFTAQDVVNLFKEKPWLGLINKNSVKQRDVLNPLSV